MHKVTASQTAKQYGAGSLLEVAKFSGLTTQGMRLIYSRDIERFHSLCWEWCKSSSEFKEHLKSAFVESCTILGVDRDRAERIAKSNGYK